MTIDDQTRWQLSAQSPLAFLGLFALFGVVTTVLFRPWMFHLSSALIGPPEDNMNDFWNTWYVTVASKPDGFFFTKMIRFPEGTSLYYQSFAYPQVFAVALLSKVVGTDLPSLLFLQNISLLISFPLAAVGAFYLVRYFTKNTAGALIGGFVFAFNPSHVAHVMHHAHVSSIEFIPFFVLCYLLAIESKSTVWLGLAITFYVLSALSCWYYLFYIAYFIIFHSIYTAIRARILPKGWSLLAPIACLSSVVIILSPLLIPMVRQAMGPTSVYMLGSDIYVADLVGYFVFPPVHLLSFLTTDIFWTQLTGNPWESTVYLGLGNLLILTWLCFFAKQKNDDILIYVLCGMALFAVLASGSSLHILGSHTIPMPDRLLSELPFFRNVRTPSRAIVFVYLFLAIGIGHAFALIWQHRRRPSVRWALFAGTALIVLDFYPAHLALTPVSCSPGLALIRDDPELGFGVLNLPRGWYEDEAYMLQQVCHGRPIAQGLIARDLVVTLRDRLEMSDLQAQRRQLADAKVKYVVISHPTEELFRWAPEDGPLADYPQTYPIVYDGREMTILRVY